MTFTKNQQDQNFYKYNFPILFSVGGILRADWSYVAQLLERQIITGFYTENIGFKAKKSLILKVQILQDMS